MMHEWPVRIYYEDTDSGGVVYHSNYLKYMERARTEWLRSLGIDQVELKKIFSVMFVVKELAIKYLKPAKFDDEIIVQTKVTKNKNCSLNLTQKIIRNKEVLTDSVVEIVCINVNLFKPTRIPQDIKKVMEII
jgi:acyl-CoA thioester hydrolase